MKPAYNKCMAEDKMTEQMKTDQIPVDNGPSSEKKKRRHRYVSVMRIIHNNFTSFFLFELFYKMIIFLLLIPLLKKIGLFALYINKIDYLTNDNIFTFIQNPFTWLIALVMVFMCAAVISVEYSGLISCIHASDEGRKVKVIDLFNKGIASSGRIFQPKNWMYLIYVLLILPMADVTETASLTGSFSMPGFIMEAINGSWYLSLIYITGMVLLMVLAVRWIYVIPIMEIEKKSFFQSVKKSSTLTKKKLFRTFFILCAWTLSILAIFFCAGVVFILAATVFVLWLDNTLVLESVMTTIGIGTLVVGFILFSILASAIILSRVYVGYKENIQKTGDDIAAYEKPETWIEKHRWSKVLIAASIIVGNYFFLPERYQEVKTVLTNASGTTMVMAHRGDSVAAPENTLPAFQAAIDNGADAAEMDVQMCKDGTIVVLHDSSINRTSTGSGNIWDLTYDEIKNQDNGSFFSSEFSDTHIPTLDQVIKLCKGKLYLNIEIKRTGHDDGIEQKVLDIIHDNDFTSQCDITSMDYATLVTVRSLDDSIKTVYTTNVAYGSISSLTAADAFSVEGTFVTSGFVRTLHQNGKQVFVWTIDDENQMQTMINLGVDVVITNDPVTCKEVVNSEFNTGIFGTLNRLRTSFF